MICNHSEGLISGKFDIQPTHLLEQPVRPLNSPGSANCFTKQELMEKVNCPDLNVVDMGPVVQSIVSLTSSLRGQLVKCFTTI